MAHETDVTVIAGTQRGNVAETRRGGRSGVYVIGLALAGLLTLGSFQIAEGHQLWGPGVPIALAVLAIAQMGVHLVFFLHITTAPDSANNVLALAFGILIVALVIIGSIWILGHLNANMMPPSAMMKRGL